MASKCAREECGKTVYPLEELKCLDKVWHKQCFKCHTCGMVLSMKTYKGFEKRPYCEAHYPKISYTAVTDTPEMITAKGNTQFQSQVKYHEAYEKTKGQKIEVTDDPELKRLIQNTKNQSVTEYHKDGDKKKVHDSNRPHYDFLSSSTNDCSVVDVPDENTIINNMINSSATYGYGKMSHSSESPYSQRLACQAAGTLVYSSEQEILAEQRPVGKIEDYEPMKNGSQPQKDVQQVQKASAPGSKAQTQTPSTGKQDATGFAVKALYDYAAADKDEVSFTEGDIIVNCQMVDEGWMTGTVQRTLMWGMLPANYVEKVNAQTGKFKLK